MKGAGIKPSNHQKKKKKMKEQPPRLPRGPRRDAAAHTGGFRGAGERLRRYLCFSVGQEQVSSAFVFGRTSAVHHELHLNLHFLGIVLPLDALQTGRDSGLGAGAGLFYYVYQEVKRERTSSRPVVPEKPSVRDWLLM